MWPVRHPHHLRCGAGVGRDVFHLASPLDLVRRSEDGAVAEHVHVGDVGPKMEHHLRSKTIHHTIYSKSTYLLQIEEVSLIQ